MLDVKILFIFQGETWWFVSHGTYAAPQYTIIKADPLSIMPKNLSVGPCRKC